MTTISIHNCNDQETDRYSEVHQKKKGKAHVQALMVIGYENHPSASSSTASAVFSPLPRIQHLPPTRTGTLSSDNEAEDEDTWVRTERRRRKGWLNVARDLMDAG